jgi:hypothetical protein
MRALAMLREALALAEARVKRRGLRFWVRGGLTPEGEEIAFTGGKHYCPDPGEPFEEFAARICAVAEGPVILGGLPPLPGTNTRWTADLPEPSPKLLEDGREPPEG